MREIHHRLANTLVLLAASLHRGLVAVDDPIVRTILGDRERKVLELAKLLRNLNVGRPDRADSELYFRTLCEGVARMILEPISASCAAPVADAPLSVRRCQRADFIIGELIADAVKHTCGKDDKFTRRTVIAFPSQSRFRAVADNCTGIESGRHTVVSGILQPLVHALNGALEVYPDPLEILAL